MPESKKSGRKRANQSVSKLAHNRPRKKGALHPMEEILLVVSRTHVQLQKPKKQCVRLSAMFQKNDENLQKLTQKLSCRMTFPEVVTRNP